MLHERLSQAARPLSLQAQMSPDAMRARRRASFWSTGISPLWFRSATKTCLRIRIASTRGARSRQSTGPDGSAARERSAARARCAPQRHHDAGVHLPGPVRKQTLVHVHPDQAVIGAQFAADLAIPCSTRAFIRALGGPHGVVAKRGVWIDQLKAAQRKVAQRRMIEVSDGVPFESVVDVIGRHLPSDAVVTLDAGTFEAPAYRLIPFAPPQRLLASASGAMGFGVPAAVAAALRMPHRCVICLVGDGGFLMTGNELAVARERGVAPKIVLSENGTYASIRIDQEREYPGPRHRHELHQSGFRPARPGVRLPRDAHPLH
jgi:thiamine pyrophosphate-dependent enzyme